MNKKRSIFIIISLIIFYLVILSGIIFALVQISPQLLVKPNSNAWEDILKKVSKIDNAIPGKEVSLKVTQEELTFLLQTTTANSNDPINILQFAINGSFVEIIARMKYSIVPFILRLQMKPQVLKGEISLLVTNAWMGKIKLPQIAVTKINQKVKDNFTSQFSSINESIVITKIKLKDNGSALIFGKLITEK